MRIKSLKAFRLLSLTDFLSHAYTSSLYLLSVRVVLMIRPPFVNSLFNVNFFLEKVRGRAKKKKHPPKSTSQTQKAPSHPHRRGEFVKRVNLSLFLGPSNTDYCSCVCVCCVWCVCYGVFVLYVCVCARV